MNMDEFLDNVSSQDADSKNKDGKNIAPSKEDVLKAMSYMQNTSTVSASASMSTNVKNPTQTELQNQFESLSLALETSLASSDFQHAFDTYIALQSTLASLHEQQRNQQKTFQEKLNHFKSKLFSSVQESSVKFQSIMNELYAKIAQIKQLADSNQTAVALSQYGVVKKTVEQLPNSFADKKEKLQDELLKIYLYLKDRNEVNAASKFNNMANEMKNIYIASVAAIRASNFTQAQNLYEQLAAKYAQLPDGYTEQKVQLFDYVTFLHSQLSLDTLSPKNLTNPSQIKQNSPNAQQVETYLNTAATSDLNKNNNTPKVIPQPPSPSIADLPSIPMAPEVAKKVQNESYDSKLNANYNQTKKPMEFAPSFTNTRKPQSLKEFSMSPSKPIYSSANNVEKKPTLSPIDSLKISMQTKGSSTENANSKISDNISNKNVPAIIQTKVEEKILPKTMSSNSSQNSSSNLSTQDAQQLQERARQLTARLAELKRSIA